MQKEIHRVIKTWQAIRRWQCTGDDGNGNTCGPALFSAHEDALLDLEATLQLIAPGDFVAVLAGQRRD